jgi:cysteine desulfurase family protein (TIGR01976 family)
MSEYDVAGVRAHFPALDEGAAHFDGPGGSQVPDVVADAVAGVLRSAVANRGTVTRAERRADRIVMEARLAAADLLGAECIVFGRSMTQLTYDLARALAKQWRRSDEIVVSRLDHDANIRPWLHAAQGRGVTVRWAEFDPHTGELPVEAVEISERTRLVAVTAASNLLGTRPDITAIAQRAHRAGALVYVDGVHFTPHCFVDVAAMGADFFACSPYKFLGPHLGLVGASAQLLESVHPDKLLPMTDAVPERFELGTLPYELLAGTTAAIDFLAGLVPAVPVSGSRRQRLEMSMRALQAHEDGLRERLETGLGGLDGVTIHGSPRRRRTPTVLFSVAGHAPAQVHEHLARCGVNAPAGSFYAPECARHLGLGDAGAVRAGISPYTDSADVDRLLNGVADLPR